MNVDLSVASQLFSINQNYQFYPQPTHLTPVDPMIIIGAETIRVVIRKIEYIYIIVFLVKTY